MPSASTKEPSAGDERLTAIRSAAVSNRPRCGQPRPLQQRAATPDHRRAGLVSALAPNHAVALAHAKRELLSSQSAVHRVSTLSHRRHRSSGMGDADDMRAYVAAGAGLGADSAHGSGHKGYAAATPSWHTGSRPGVGIIAHSRARRGFTLTNVDVNRDLLARDHENTRVWLPAPAAAAPNVPASTVGTSVVRTAADAHASSADASGDGTSLDWLW